MVQYQDIKPGDLILSKHSDGTLLSKAVIIGWFPQKTSFWNSFKLNMLKNPLEIMCYQRFEGELYKLRSFFRLNNDEWNKSAKADYLPQGQNKKLSRELLESAKFDLTQPVYKARPLKKLGLQKGNAEKVLNTIEALLKE